MEREPELRALMTAPEWDEGTLRRALELVNRSGAEEFTREQARRFYQVALEELHRCGLDNHAVRALEELAAFVVGREY